MNRRFALAKAEVIGVAEVTDVALTETMRIQVVRAQAEHMAPDGAEHYAYIAFRGVLRMAAVIDRV